MLFWHIPPPYNFVSHTNCFKNTKKPKSMTKVTKVSNNKRGKIRGQLKCTYTLMNLCKSLLDLSIISCLRFYDSSVCPLETVDCQSHSRSTVSHN